jgi:pimeloyl-ACP methyl ester carboxylesterase
VSTDVWLRFQCGTTAERLALITDPSSRILLASRLGADAVRGYLDLAARLPGGGAHLGDDQPPNVVFVPGVMGSVLASRGLGGVWWLDVRSVKRLNSLGLTDDGSEDTTTGARVEPVTVDASYDAFCTATLAQPDLGHRIFPYDWRRPIPAVVGDLQRLVRETFAHNGNRPVHLVAHSMGGLVVREALRTDPDLWGRIGRIAFLATPHYGSPAIAGYLKNHLWGFELLALLGHYLSRATFRSMWGVLDLLPAPAGVYPDSTPGDPESHPCANFDLHDAAAYRLGLTGAEQARLQRVLDGARDFHVALADWHRSLPQERRDRMLVVAGVGYKTLFRLAYRPRFGFLWEHMDRVTSRRSGDVHREGDGRVPLASALLEHVGDTRYVRGKHGDLPAVPAVQEAAFAWVRGGTPRLPTTPQAALAATLGDADVRVEAPELAPLNGATRAADDPGYLDLDPPDEDVLRNRAQDVESDRLPRFARVTIL